MYAIAPTADLDMIRLKSDFAAVHKALTDLKLVLNTCFHVPLREHLHSSDGFIIEQDPAYKYLGIWIDND